MHAIRQEYAPTPPAYQLYLDVFATKQEEGIPTGLFISQKRALLAPPDAENRQFDMVYGLLSWEIREKIPRKWVTTFAQLLVAASEFELMMQAKSKSREPIVAPLPDSAAHP